MLDTREGTGIRALGYGAYMRVWAIGCCGNRRKSRLWEMRNPSVISRGDLLGCATPYVPLCMWYALWVREVSGNGSRVTVETVFSRARGIYLGSRMKAPSFAWT
jgi:hypothetical protein